jgi:hypothetical protein
MVKSWSKAMPGPEIPEDDELRKADCLVCFTFGVARILEWYIFGNDGLEFSL